MTGGGLVCASVVPCHMMRLVLLMVFHPGDTKTVYVNNNCHAWQTET